MHSRRLALGLLLSGSSVRHCRTPSRVRKANTNCAMEENTQPAFHPNRLVPRETHIIILLLSSARPVHQPICSHQASDIEAGPSYQQATCHQLTQQSFAASWNCWAKVRFHLLCIGCRALGCGALIDIPVDLTPCECVWLEVRLLLPKLGPRCLYREPIISAIQVLLCSIELRILGEVDQAHVEVVTEDSVGPPSYLCVVGGACSSSSSRFRVP